MEIGKRIYNEEATRGNSKGKKRRADEGRERLTRRQGEKQRGRAREPESLRKSRIQGDDYFDRINRMDRITSDNGKKQSDNGILWT
jgi:hypothetical protein